MRFYTAVVHQEGDSAFGLTFPDLPGCFAAADAWEEIPAKAAEAMDLWFEGEDRPDDLPVEGRQVRTPGAKAKGRPDVPPRPLGEVRRLPEVAAALAEGATLLTVPYIHPEGAQVRANISLDRGLLRAIDETARGRRMSRSAFLGSLARKEITGV